MGTLGFGPSGPQVGPTPSESVGWKDGLSGIDSQGAILTQGQGSGVEFLGSV